MDVEDEAAWLEENRKTTETIPGYSDGGLTEGWYDPKGRNEEEESLIQSHQ